MAQRPSRAPLNRGRERNAKQLPSLPCDRARQRRPAHRRVPFARCGPRVRRLRDQHDPAYLPAARRRTAATATVGDDNRGRT